jgi:hypothetical protein
LNDALTAKNNLTNFSPDALLDGAESCAGQGLGQGGVEGLRLRLGPDPDGEDGEGEGGEESLSSRPRPVWLETLLGLYSREVAPPATSSGLPPVGSLCAFLSCCATKQVATTKAEHEAILEVSRAHIHLYHTMPCHALCA